MMYGLLTMLGKKRQKVQPKSYRVYWCFHNQHDQIHRASLLAASPKDAATRLRALIGGYISTPIEIVVITDEGAPNE